MVLMDSVLRQPPVMGISYYKWATERQNSFPRSHGFDRADQDLLGLGL